MEAYDRAELAQMVVKKESSEQAWDEQEEPSRKKNVCEEKLVGSHRVNES